jgi:hypothetical protein
MGPAVISPWSCAARWLLSAAVAGSCLGVARAESIADFSILASDPNNSITASDLTVSGGLIGSNTAGAITLAGTNTLAGIRTAGSISIFNSTTTSSADMVTSGKFTSTASIVNGNLFGSAPSTLSGSLVTGNVQANGGLSLLLNTTVNGNVFSGGNAAFLMVPTQNVNGNLTTTGNVTLNTGTSVSGNLTAGGTLTNSGGKVSGTISQNATVVAPAAQTFTPIALPAATSFTAGTKDVSIANGGSQVLAPGSYHDLTVGTNTTLTLSAGNYYFNNFNPSSTVEGVASTGLVKLDMSAGPINIFVAGQLNDSGSTIEVKAPGSSTFADPFAAGASTALQNLASNVYIEVQGTGPNAAMVQNAASEIFGTIYTPHGGMFLEGSDKLIGSLVSGGAGGIGAESLSVNFMPSLELASEASTAHFQDPLQPLDVNGDHMVSPLDGLIILNELNAAGPHSLTGTAPGADGPFFDVNGDGSVSSSDSLAIINFLNGQGNAGSSAAPSAVVAAEAFGPSPEPVPEPSTLLLAAAVALATLVGQAVRRRSAA